MQIKISFPLDSELLQGKTIPAVFSASFLGPTGCLAWSRISTGELSKRNACMHEYVPE